jgi:hypothetical protein
MEIFKFLLVLGLLFIGTKMLYQTFKFVPKPYKLLSFGFVLGIYFLSIYLLIKNFLDVTVVSKVFFLIFVILIVIGYILALTFGDKDFRKKQIGVLLGLIISLGLLLVIVSIFWVKNSFF